MFSTKEKQMIAAAVEKVLLDINHPEMPKERPSFQLHVEGKESWSWADIQPNWKYDVEISSDVGVAGQAEELARRLRAYERQLAPHAKEREGGILLVEVTAALAAAVECVQALHETATALSVIATKHCPKEHHDWQRLLELAGKL